MNLERSSRGHIEELTWHLHKETEENYEKHQHSQCSGPDLNPAHPKRTRLEH